MTNKAFPVSQAVALAALSVIPADDRDVWWRMGMALKSEYGEDGYQMFFDWSEGSVGFDAAAVKSTWKSFKHGGRVTIGSLIAEAKKHGFNPKDHASAAPLSAEQKAQARRNREARDKAAAEDTERQHKAAARQAEKDWAAAQHQGRSRYLERKQVLPHGVRFEGGIVLVPLRDMAGKLWNLQRIHPNGNKVFPGGGRVSGCFHVLGELAHAALVLFAEGYATAATLHEATGWPVVVCFNEVNLRNVAKVARELAPSAVLLFCADDDQATAQRIGKNPGIVSAQEAAVIAGGAWCKPEGLPPDRSDFNDLAELRGKEEVKAQILAACDRATGYADAVAAGAAPTVRNDAGSGAAPTPAPQPTQHSESRKRTDAQRKASNAAKAAAEQDSQAGRPFFNVDERGVWYHGFSNQGDPLPAQWICSELHVTAKSRDATGNGWGYLLEFTDGDGVAKRWAMPSSMLSGDGTQYRAVLLSMGLRIGTGTAAKNHLSSYIQTQQIDARVRCTERIGSHDDVYVMPDQTIGEGEEMVMFQADGGVVSQFKQRGTLEEWRREVAAHCQGNSRLLFCVSAAFAAPLLYLAHVPSGGFHIWGDSSSGKSTAVKVAGSVYGGKDYPRNWRMTDNALETVATQHSDALLVLDEIAQVDPKVVGDIVYMLGNETGKGRATQTATARKVASWRLLFLSDGEISLANHMEQAGKGSKAGHDVRMAHIAADAGCGLGLFETLHGFASGAALSDHLVQKAGQCYGTAGMAFIDYAVREMGPLREALQENVGALAKELCPADAHGQVSRVATRFALVGTAGELATAAGITGWESGEAIDAARTCFAAWLEGRGGAGNVEHTSILRQVSGFFQAHGDARFTWWHRANDDHKPNTINRAGFKRMLSRDGTAINSNADHHKAYGDKMHPDDAEHASQEYFVFSEIFRDEICKGFNPKTVTRLLVEQGLLLTDSDGGATRKERLPGMGMARVYRFKPEVVGLNV
jgi:putative DNA primase/helicase